MGGFYIMNLHESGEMYLETILVLKKKSGPIRSIDIVNHTGYSKPSVSRAVNLLKGSGYLTVDEAGYITLTENGVKVASRMYERHNLLTRFFVEIGVSESVAAEDACKIEHFLSDETFEKIKLHMS